MRTVIGALALLLAAMCSHAQQIPSGTLLPTMLDNTLDSNKTKPGEEISAKLMQDVPLADGTKLKRDAKVLGHVVAVVRSPSGRQATISVQFDRIGFEKQAVPISVGLRALASMEAVALAKEPINSGYGTSVWDWNMRQIGGQIAFNGDKIVKSQTGQVVGKVSQPGAVLAIPMANPARGCAGASGNTAEQAFWVFSTDACGLYDEKNMTFVSGIGGATPGQVVLQSPKSVEVRGGSGWLLQVN